MAKTVEEVASALGVSITTVRLVVNKKAQKYRVAKATIQKVEDYIAEHGLKINHAARSLKLQKSQTFGLIIPRLANPFFARYCESLETLCRQNSYQLITVCTNSDAETERSLYVMLCERGIDGVFAVSSGKDSQEFLINHSDKPLVGLDRNYGHSQICNITSDNVEGGRQIAAALSPDGEPLYILAGGYHQPTIQDRLAGVLMIHEGENGHPQDGYVFTGMRNTHEFGAQMMDELLAQTDGETPPNILCSSLPVLQGALARLQQHCGHIPANIRIGTFDDHEMLDFLPNDVWSMKQNSDKLAEASFQAMMDTMAGKTSSNPTIPMTLIHRKRFSAAA